MYESFYGFDARPFAAAPVVESYFPAQAIEQARQTLIRVVERAEGPGLVVGPAGVGKSLLCRMLAEYFQESFDVVTLACTRIGTRKALLQHILFELDLPYRDLEEGELRLSLLDYLQPGKSHAQGMLLLVDEAHTLPLRLLDEIRMITNLVRDGKPRVRLVLAGGPQLEERFTHPKLESFNQRLAARCYLEPLSYDETLNYVRAQLSAAGVKPDTLLDEGALQAIYRASDGIPRLINQVCDHALVLACAGGQRKLDAACIQEAWSDLQQLPAPWYDRDARADSAGAVVEFGELEDAAAQPPQESASPAQPLSGETPATQPSSEDDALAVFDTAWQTPFGQTADPPQEEFDATLETEAEDEAEDEVQAAAPAECEPSHEDTPDEQTVFEAGDDVSQPVAEHVDPFGSAFQDEEVVIDRYASLEIETFRGRPRVTSAESHALAAALPDIEPAPPLDGEATPEPAAVSEDEYHGEPGDDLEDREETVVEDGGPVTGDLQSIPEPSEPAPGTADAAHQSALFEFTVFEPSPATGASLDLAEVFQPATTAPSNESSDAGVELRCVEFPVPDETAMDDRDLIVVEDEVKLEQDAEEEADAAQTPRVEYQELFAQLRKL